MCVVSVLSELFDPNMCRYTCEYTRAHPHTHVHNIQIFIYLKKKRKIRRKKTTKSTSQIKKKKIESVIFHFTAILFVVCECSLVVVFR